MKREIIVFGKGAYYEGKKRIINETYHVAAFLDNTVKPGYVGWKDGLEIYNPQDKEKYDDGTGIFLASNRWFEMWEQLMRLGVDEKRIIFGIGFPPFSDGIEEIFYEKKVTIVSKEGKIFLQTEEREWNCPDEITYKAVVRELFAESDPYIKLIANMPLKPASRRFGLERGTAIDRFYIERFLARNKEKIKGTVMEIAEDRYMRMFRENIKESVILHVNGWGEGVIKGDLATGEGIVENSVDCMICTQTLPFIYDIHHVVKNIYKLLKPKGTLLLTASAISQISLYDYNNWGDYWRFTGQSMKALLMETFSENQVDICTYGNMKTAIIFLYGMCLEEIAREDLEYQDEQFPMIVAAVARKES